MCANETDIIGRRASNKFTSSLGMQTSRTMPSHLFYDFHFSCCFMTISQPRQQHLTNCIDDKLQLVAQRCNEIFLEHFRSESPAYKPKWNFLNLRQNVCARGERQRSCADVNDGIIFHHLRLNCHRLTVSSESHECHLWVMWANTHTRTKSLNEEMNQFERKQTESKTKI